MKMLFLSTFDYPSRYAHAIHGLEMARALARQSDMLFVCNTVVDPRPLEEVPYALLFGRFGRRVKKLRLRRLLFLPAAFLRAVLHRPDAIYTTEPALYASGSLLARMTRARFVAECHGPVTRREERALSRADAIFFVTRGLRERFLMRNPGDGPKAFVLENAVDIDRYVLTPDDPTALRRELGIPLGRYLIGYIGRFEPRGEDKGVKLMIDSLSQLSFDTDLLLVGASKAEAATYGAYAAEHSVAARVHIVPHVDMRIVPRYAKACDCLVYIPPSSTFTEVETSPMKLYEYMAAGKPIIVSGTRAIRDVLRDDEAVFITPGSGTEFVEAVAWVRGNLDEVRDRAHRALARVSGNTWEKRADRIVQAATLVV